VSLLLGLASVGLLLELITGVPALVVGLLCLRRFNAADPPGGVTPRGVTLGRRLAIAGMALGFAGSVFGVVTITIMLLAPSVEQSRRIVCENNLRVLGKANVSYYEINNYCYPPATLPSTQSVRALPYADRAGWVPALLPYLMGTPDRPGPYVNLGSQFDPERAWDADPNRKAADTPLPLLVCPALPPSNQSGQPGLSTYVGMTGVGAEAVELPQGAAGAGFFGYERRLQGLRQHNPLPRGATYTLFVTETTQENGPWAAGGPSTLRAIVTGTQPYVGIGRSFGGLHAKGLNLLYADGRVQFFSEKGSPRILETAAELGGMMVGE
jgi:prepilin-type processing-associated H-X9-DG protein